MCPDLAGSFPLREYDHVPSMLYLYKYSIFVACADLNLQCPDSTFNININKSHIFVIHVITLQTVITGLVRTRLTNMDMKESMLTRKS